MNLKKIKIGNKSVMPFTIPSGIVTTQVKCLEKVAQEIPEIGVLTTKSIGPEPRAGNREPILAQYIPGGFVNAVGLTNPGAEEFAQQLSTINFPEDKFLLASIFGSNADEFIYVAKTLEERVDGFELNLSCPHCEQVGMVLGQDPEMVRKITKEVVKVTKKPVLPKLTPNANNIGEIARVAVSAGAQGIVAINTVGPGYYSTDGEAVLTNKIGGLSGIGILPIGLKCIREIRQATGDDMLIISMGGIRTVKDVEAYAAAGANVFGIGSALVGMDDYRLNGYFQALIGDIRSNGWTNNAVSFLHEINMKYQKVRIEKEIKHSDDFKTIVTDNIIPEVEPGQFVFAWIPGVGEKPFSVMDNNPLTLGVLERGEFTKKFNSLKKGDYFYVRGPYGKAIDIPKDHKVVLVGGGCGIAGISLIAKVASQRLCKKKLTILLGAKDIGHIPYLDKFREYGEVFIATEDGILGKKGLVSDLIRNLDLKKGSYFLNCGLREMISAILPLELEISSPERIYSSADYMTRCGVGICGSCADEKGRRTCVEGPFMQYKE